MKYKALHTIVEAVPVKLAGRKLMAIVAGDQIFLVDSGAFELLFAQVEPPTQATASAVTKKAESQPSRHGSTKNAVLAAVGESARTSAEIHDALQLLHVDATNQAVYQCLGMLRKQGLIEKRPEAESGIDKWFLSRERS